MLKQATVQDIANHRITKLHGEIIVITRFYPRFLKRNLVHEYIGVLAPSKELLKEFKDKEKKLDGDHDRAFELVDYESKFNLEPEGWQLLREIAERPGTTYFICHCEKSQYCHRELLMIAAEKMTGVSIPKLSHDYATFRKRITARGDILLP